MQGGTVTTAGVGARVLGEVEETSLDEVYPRFPPHGLRIHHPQPQPQPQPQPPPILPALPPPPPRTNLPLPPLTDLVARHHRATGSAPLALTGSRGGLDLVYHLVATLVAAPQRMAVSVVDLDGRFDVLRLLATGSAERADLEHVHVVRPPDGAAVGGYVKAVEEYMLYGGHGSRGREWWGSVVVVGGRGRGKGEGDIGGSVGVVVGDWNGWMRVERGEMGGLGDVSVEEALEGREGREREVEGTGWVGMSAWGGFWFGGWEGDGGGMG
ncbi:hypothetical protein B0T18DRAFT_478336 [Schizothecium vesticola]|uniref:Uncharacterized protein n=1 Tax=Schizothecium vesticola TaxID=314040 RepID=A0AA40F512_9PEZI|nr:hypothetical protein B0T18DRAFT_478336 [Schizothecium vesticola]